MCIRDRGVISLLFAVLLAAAAVLSAQKGNTEYVVLYIIVGILVLLYVPFSLKGRVKMIMKTNEVFSKPLHFAVDEKHINVSQGDEMAQLPWEQEMCIRDSRIPCWIGFKYYQTNCSKINSDRFKINVKLYVRRTDKVRLFYKQLDWER